MPKSMTRGPSIVTRMFAGLRSRWTRPASWTAVSARASRLARIRTDRSGSGSGRPAITSCREGPGTYPVATHGAAASVSASSTGAVHSPPTRRAEAISCAKRLRNSGSAASSERTSFTATVRPPAERAR